MKFRQLTSDKSSSFDGEIKVYVLFGKKLDLQMSDLLNRF